MHFELTETDGDVIDVFLTREAALEHVRRWFGEPIVGPAKPHFPEGTIEAIHVTPEETLCYLVTCESED